MSKNRFVVLSTLAAVLLAIGACGSQELPATGSPGTTTTSDGSPTTNSPVTSRSSTGPSDTSAEFEVEMGADTVVVSHSITGGLVPSSVAFQRPPEMIVTGDNRVIQPGAPAEDYPGPFIPPLTERTISDAGIQQLLAAADGAGLLREVDYKSSTQIADAETTTVDFGVGDESWIHEVYALGFYGVDETDLDAQSIAAHEALIEFLAQLDDLPAVVGDDELGPTSRYRPEAYLIKARPLNAISAESDESQLAVIEWPASASVRLADASSCVRVNAAAVAEAFESSTAAVVFVDQGVQYSVLAKQDWPGADC